MKIHFERSGGFMGVRMATMVDDNTLPNDEARDLRQMVESAGFFDLPAHLTSATPGADQFHYVLTVEAEDRMHTVTTTDAAAPPELQPLLRRLTLLARSQRNRE